MKNYRTLIKRMDSQGASPADICRALKLDPTRWDDVWACARIYTEDGGRRYSYDEFIAAINPPTPPELDGAWKEFAGWNPQEWE